MRTEYNFTPAISDLGDHVIIAGKMNQQQTRRRRPRVMSPLMWGLLVAFILAALVTSYLTFIVVREVVLAQNPFTALKPLFIKARQPDGTPFSVSSPLQNSEGPTPQPWDGADRVTVLFIGLDLRDWEDGGEGPSRTDTMILFTVDPANKTAGMLSIPRDLWVNIPGYGYGKINTAHYLGEVYDLPGGGPGLAVKTVEDLLGVKINYYARVDFVAFERFIDELGGIEVNVPEEITVDPIGPHNTVTLSPGFQLLDGPTALAYARNRETIGGDFDRAQRQQQVVLAIRSKILDLNMMPTLVTKAPTLYKQLAAGIQTNLSLEEMIKLGWLASQISSENIRQAAIGPDQVTFSTSPDGLDILLPDTDKIRMLRDEIFTETGPVVPAQNLGDPVELMKAENATVSVLNATYTAGLASQTSDYLKSQGINVTDAGNAQEVSEYTTIIDYSGKPYTVQFLVNLMHIQQNRIYSRYEPNSEVDLVILLGADWATSNTMP